MSHAYGAHGPRARQMRLSLEPLTDLYGVDVFLYGHVHAYERSTPVSNYTVDPCGAVHLTIGDAGNSEGLSFLNNFRERKLRARPPTLLLSALLGVFSTPMPPLPTVCMELFHMHMTCRALRRHDGQVRACHHFCSFQGHAFAEAQLCQCDRPLCCPSRPASYDTQPCTSSERACLV